MDAQVGTRLWDRGKVYKGDERIAEVVYALQVVQEIIGGVEQKDLAGQIRVVEGTRNLVNEGVLVLKLVGGRTWEFFASNDMGSGVYNVMGIARRAQTA